MGRVQENNKMGFGNCRLVTKGSELEREQGGVGGRIGCGKIVKDHDHFSTSLVVYKRSVRGNGVPERTWFQLETQDK